MRWILQTWRCGEWSINDVLWWRWWRKGQAQSLPHASAIWCSNKVQVAPPSTLFTVVALSCHSLITNSCCCRTCCPVTNNCRRSPVGPASFEQSGGPCRTGQFWSAGVQDPRLLVSASLSYYCFPAFSEDKAARGRIFVYCLAGIRQCLTWR